MGLDDLRLVIYRLAKRISALEKDVVNFKAQKEKAEAPVKEPQPLPIHDEHGRCLNRDCAYEYGGRYSCEYHDIT